MDNIRGYHYGYIVFEVPLPTQFCLFVSVHSDFLLNWLYTLSKTTRSRRLPFCECSNLPMNCSCESPRQSIALIRFAAFAILRSTSLELNRPHSILHHCFFCSFFYSCSLFHAAALPGHVRESAIRQKIPCQLFGPPKDGVIDIAIDEKPWSVDPQVSREG